MKIIAALTQPPAIQSFLDAIGLASRPPLIAPVRPILQTELEYAD